MMKGGVSKENILADSSQERQILIHVHNQGRGPVLTKVLELEGEI